MKTAKFKVIEVTFEDKLEMIFNALKKGDLKEDTKQVLIDQLKKLLVVASREKNKSILRQKVEEHEIITAWIRNYLTQNDSAFIKKSWDQGDLKYYYNLLPALENEICSIGSTLDVPVKLTFAEAVEFMVQQKINQQ